MTVVTDPGMEPLMRGLLRAHGAEVDVVREPHPSGGWQQARRERVDELLMTAPDAWCPTSTTTPTTSPPTAVWPTS
ncbi:hypothetical protein GCM10020221_14310 [Streptomyces thioluteus]|uniref:Uncharacterized protein n=1 Tax=Streptomyces thioluteus TaxID=66431 RepID=A0ABN3WJY5_STRTU